MVRKNRQWKEPGTKPASRSPSRKQKVTEKVPERESAPANATGRAPPGLQQGQPFRTAADFEPYPIPYDTPMMQYPPFRAGNMSIAPFAAVMDLCQVLSWHYKRSLKATCVCTTEYPFISYAVTDEFTRQTILVYVEKDMNTGLYVAFAYETDILAGLSPCAPSGPLMHRTMAENAGEEMNNAT